MIGLDTNILVRYFARDDPYLTPKADALLDSLTSDRRGYIPTAVLVELAWTMDRSYRATRHEIIRIVGLLIESNDLVLESQSIVKSALRLFSTTVSDFADCLILRACQHAGCEYTETFDRKASRAIGMRLVT